MVVDNTQPEGQNPIENVTIEFMGHQNARNSSSHRDLGFTGHLQGKWYAVYGDTMWCDAGIANPEEDTEGFHGMVRNSLSALTDDPLVVHDLHLNDDEPVPHQNQLVPFNEDWGETNTFGFGGTSIVETDAESGTGALYYLINDAEHCKGAGVAKIELINDVPTVTERLGENGWWWDGDHFPKYGDIAAYQDINSEFIYILGNPPNSESEWPGKLYVYMARVRAADAFDLNSYEYWWGRQQGWGSEVLTKFNCETAVMWGAGQGQIVYNQYFKTYIYVHLDLGGAVCLRTAPSPEGPWAEDKEIFKADPIDNGLVYAGVAYPFLDESGETLTIGFTNNNRTQIIKASFV
ncbi:Fc.00g025730.m01.CDS01 [Cosmosporella sp. VM-42]